MKTIADLIRAGWQKLPQWAKAILAGLGSGLFYLISSNAVDLSLNPVEAVISGFRNLSEFTTEQWLYLIGATLGLGSVVWWVPNQKADE